jgi:hypothetical protein
MKVEQAIMQHTHVMFVFKYPLLFSVLFPSVTTNCMNNSSLEGYDASAGQGIANFVATLTYVQQEQHKSFDIF